MATLSHAESRRLYSWWWDSHISPKNSKWLQENLTDMDVKVKTMIKLIEEDADSFRKRAEMYYRKRPELMKLVEEFYRAYRALAERYDHATGALRQAHRTMAEAFPDQIPLILMDDAPPGASIDAEPPPQGMPPRERALDYNGLQKDSVEMSSKPSAFKRIGASLEDNKATVSQGGSWKSTTGEEFANGWGRNGLDDKNVGGKGSGGNLQQEVHQLSEECQKLKNKIMHETERADKAEAEVGNLKDVLSKLESEKEAMSIQYQLSLEKISSLEADISRTKEDFKKLNDEILAGKNESKILEGRCHLVENENQFLQLEVGLLKETMEKQQEELYMKKEELEKLTASLKEEHERSMQAEMARLSLEKLLAQSQEEVKILEGRCHLVENENQFLQSEVGLLKETMEKQQEELYMKKAELEKLTASLKQEHESSMQAEMARLSLEKLLAQSQEEVRCLSLETQNWAEKLMNLEISKVGLEEEIKRLTEEIGRSNEQICTSSLKIKDLQDEIGLIEKSKRKLEDEAVQYVEEKKYLQQEVLSIKADKKALERRHHELTEQIGAVNVNVESLQAMVKDLRDGNVELKDLCKKHEDERILQLESLKFMEKITEKNAALENSLSTANAELEELREKVKILEQACEALNGKISMHISDKAVLVSQIEAVARNMEKLSEKNTLLENSLSDVNVELEGLRGNLNVLEKSCQTLRYQNSTLLAEKSSLVNEVESIGCSLENLESRYADLEGKNSNLEAEKDQILHQVRELQHSLRMQKEEYEALSQSSRNQLNDLECEIHMLQEKGRHREEELEMEHYKIIDAQIEILILQRVLHDMKEANMLLSDKCQKYLETSSCQMEHISELKQEISVQKERLISLTQFNEKLVNGVRQVIGALKVSNECHSSDDIQFRPIFLEIEDLKTRILDGQDDIQHLHLEKSVILLLLEQYGLDLAELRSEKNIIERELKARLEEILVLQSGKHELLDLNEQLGHNVQASHQREQVLKAEVEILCKNLADVQEAHSTVQRHMTKLIEENRSFVEKINDLTEKNDELEENNNALIAETLNLEHLCLIFRSYNADRALELQLLSDNMDLLRGVNSGLGQEISSLKEKLGAVEIENMDMKESLDIFEECRRHLVILEHEVTTANSTCEELNLQLETNKNLLSERDQELLQVNHEFQAVQEKNAKLSGKIEGLMMDVVVSEAAKEELGKKNLILLECNTQKDNKIADLHHLNDALSQQIDQLTEEVEQLNKKEKHLTFELMERIQEVESCEAEVETLLNDIHVTTIMAATFEEKMFELLMTCESHEISSMLQKAMFYEEISRRNVCEGELKEKLDEMDGENSGLKEELSAYLPLILSLGDCVTSLEQRILPLANHQPFSKQEKQDGSQSLLPETNNKEGNENHYALSSFGIMELQKLHAKVNTLEKVVLDILGHLENGGYAVEIGSEGLISKGTLDRDEAPMGRDIILHLKKREEMGNPKTGNTESSEQMMKDIQLDHVISSSHYQNGSSSHVPSAIGRDEDRDRMMELWGTMDCNKMEKPSPVSSERDLGCHQIEAVEEGTSISPASRLASEKELSIDKLELTNKAESHQQCSGSITESLSSDAQRLSVLQKNTQDLKRNMDASELSIAPTSFEFKQVRAELKEAEAAISQLIDANKKLARKAEKLSLSSGSLLSDQVDKIGNTSARKNSERAQKGSEKIGRLELELHKLEYIWLKLKEEHDYKKARAAERRTRVLLRDYIYGRRETPRRKKVHCCACIRPRTKDE